MSKGSKQRPEAVKGSYAANYDKIFRKPKEDKPQQSQKNG